MASHRLRTRLKALRAVSFAKEKALAALTARSIAIIMDGNGRWAAARGLPRQEGHRAGARTVRAIIEAAPRCGISTLTLYAFSSDNWKRPRPEVDALMDLMRRALRDEARAGSAHALHRAPRPSRRRAQGGDGEARG